MSKQPLLEIAAACRHLSSIHFLTLAFEVINQKENNYAQNEHPQKAKQYLKEMLINHACIVAILEKMGNRSYF